MIKLHHDRQLPIGSRTECALSVARLLKSSIAVEMSLDVEKSFMSLEVEEQFLSVPGLKTKLDFFWLRDHCRCPKCYNHDTNQRRIGIRDIGLDIRATSSEVKGDQLKVECTSPRLFDKTRV